MNASLFFTNAMNLQHIAAFSDGPRGGNPAGVVIGDGLPPDARMQQLATELGYSESVFAAPQPGGGWRVRYFSPAAEVPFCGHATIALGAALALAQGDGVFELAINHARITVTGRRDGALVNAALQSPPTRSQPLAPALRAEALALFGLQPPLVGRLAPFARLTVERHTKPDRFGELVTRQRLTELGGKVVESPVGTRALVHFEQRRNVLLRCCRGCNLVDLVEDSVRRIEVVVRRSAAELEIFVVGVQSASLQYSPSGLLGYRPRHVGRCRFEVAFKTRHAGGLTQPFRLEEFALAILICALRLRLCIHTFRIAEVSDGLVGINTRYARELFGACDAVFEHVEVGRQRVVGRRV